MIFINSRNVEEKNVSKDIIMSWGTYYDVNYLTLN